MPQPANPDPHGEPCEPRTALPMSARLPKVMLAFCPTGSCMVGTGEIGLRFLVMGRGVETAGGSTFWQGISQHHTRQTLCKPCRRH